MIELLELKFSRRWQTNKIKSDWSNSPRHSSSRQFRSPSFCSNSELFFKIHILLMPVRLYTTDDRFDKFVLMADKIPVRSTDTGFVVQSNDEAIKQCLLW